MVDRRFVDIAKLIGERAEEFVAAILECLASLIRGMLIDPVSRSRTVTRSSHKVYKKFIINFRTERARSSTPPVFAAGARLPLNIGRVPDHTDPAVSRPPSECGQEPT
jgi:hypothetical protein